MYFWKLNTQILYSLFFDIARSMPILQLVHVPERRIILDIWIYEKEVREQKRVLLQNFLWFSDVERFSTGELYSKTAGGLKSFEKQRLYRARILNEKDSKRAAWTFLKTSMRQFMKELEYSWI